MASSIAKRMGFTRKNTAPAADLNNLHGAAEKSDLQPTASTEKEPMVEVTNQVTELEANRQLNALKKKHKWDPNLPADTLDDLDDATNTHDVHAELNLVDALTENSPYPEVRAAVRNVSSDLH